MLESSAEDWATSPEPPRPPWPTPLFVRTNRGVRRGAEASFTPQSEPRRVESPVDPEPTPSSPVLLRVHPDAYRLAQGGSPLRRAWSTGDPHYCLLPRPAGLGRRPLSGDGGRWPGPRATPASGRARDHDRRVPVPGAGAPVLGPGDVEERRRGARAGRHPVRPRGPGRVRPAGRGRPQRARIRSDYGRQASRGQIRRADYRSFPARSRVSAMPRMASVTKAMCSM